MVSFFICTIYKLTTEVYSVTMRFTEVVDALINGKKVRRASWQRVNGYVTCDFTQMTISVGGIDSPFSLNTISLLADDWEVVNDQSRVGELFTGR